MTSDNPLSETPRRSWLPHPMWLLAVAVVFLGVGVACSVYFHPTARLIREVNAIGGYVDSQYVGPDWLVRFVDEDRLTFLHRVRAVHLSSHREINRHIQRLTGHRIVDPEDFVTDEWLKRLSGLRELESLSLDDLNISDVGVANLNNLPNLRHLNLCRCDIGDTAMKSLKQFPRLEWLWLTKTQITDAGLVHLGEMSQLKTLNLRWNAVTDAGLANLERLANLRSLDLAITHVTAAGLVHLRSMTNLESLDLSSSALDENGLQHLKHLTSLREFQIDETPEIAGRIADLKDALPKLNSNSGNSH